MDSNYWDNGERVRVTLPAEMAEMAEPSEPSEAMGSSGEWWPSRTARAVWLEDLTPAEAGRIADGARRELALWLAGDGLHPVAWLRRWSGALSRLAPDLLPPWARAAGVRSPEFERAAVMALFPRSVYTQERRRLNAVWLGLGKKVWRGDGPAGPGAAPADLDGVLSGARALEWAGREAAPAEAEEEAGAVAASAAGALARWIGAEGGWCLGALKRYYVLVYYYYGELAPGMSGDDFARIYGQGRAAFSADAQRLMGRRLELLTGRAVSVAGQKAPETRAVYAANAARHAPRRQLSGMAGWEGRPDADAEQGRAARGGQARLREAREEARRRETARDAEAMRKLSERVRKSHR